MNTFTEENYLKAIYKLSLTKGVAVSTNYIASQVNTKAATVTDMLKKLADKNLIVYQKYQGVTLTDSGKKTALAIVRKHRLWEFFLVEKLRFKWDEVHDIAEQLEHIRSDELINELDRFLGFPKFDPHGDPIPDKNGKMTQSKSSPLSSIKHKNKLVVKGVEDHSKAFLQYLNKTGIFLGDTISLSKTIDYDKSVEVSLKNKKIFLSHDAAKNILVEKL